MDRENLPFQTRSASDLRRPLERTLSVNNLHHVSYEHGKSASPTIDLLTRAASYSKTRKKKESSSSKKRVLLGFPSSPNTAEEDFKSALSEVNAKKLQQLKLIRFPGRSTKALAEALLILFAKVDKSVPVDAGLKVSRSTAWLAFLAYISSPGNVILTMRKFPELIQTKKISAKTIRRTRETLCKAKNPQPKFLSDFLNAAVALYESIHTPKTKRPASKMSLPLPLFTVEDKEQTYETPRFLGLESWKELSEIRHDGFEQFLKRKLVRDGTIVNRDEAYSCQNNWIEEYCTLYGDISETFKDTSEFRKLTNEIRLELLKEMK